MNTPFIHAATPARLKAAFKRAKGKDGQPYNMRVLAQEHGVNVYYVHRLIKHGLEPSNPRIRSMLYLPKHPRGAKSTRRPIPPHVKWWRYKLTKESRNVIVERLYQHAQEINNAGKGDQT